METWDRLMHERDDAAAQIQRHYPRLSIRADQAGDFALRHSGVTDPRWSLQRLRVRGSVVMNGSVDEVYGVGRRVTGRALLTYGRTEVDMTSPYLRPVGRSELVLDHVTLELVTLEPVALRAHASRYLLGTRSRLVAPSPAATAPTDRVAERLRTSTQRYVRELVDDPEVLDSPLLRDHIYDVIVRSFLRSFAVTETESAVPGPTTAATPAAVRRALEHMDAHASESVTIADLAATARVSVRTLQAGIRRHTGLTAMQYLRERRLMGARDELLAADPATTTVATIARKWGFGHVSRFSHHYFLLFGEYPRDSLGT